MVKALLSQGIKKTWFYLLKKWSIFPLREESDADTLPAFFLETEKQKEYVKRTFLQCTNAWNILEYRHIRKAILT